MQIGGNRDAPSYVVDERPVFVRPVGLPHGTRVSSSLAVGLRSGNFEWKFDAEFLSEIGSPDHLLSLAAHSPPSSIVKTGPHRTVTRLELPSGEYYVKQFRIAGWRPLLQNLVRPCKAILEWNALRGVAALGLPTVQPVSLGQEIRCGLVWGSFLVTRSIEGARALDEYFNRTVSASAESLRPALRQKLTAALGLLIGQMHARGAVHPDLHPGNILVRTEGDQPRLWLIDLHAVRFQRHVSPHEAAVSLAALNQFFGPQVTPSDRRRFFRAYCTGRGWTRRVERATLRQFTLWCHAATQSLWNRADRAWRRGNRHQRRLDAAHVSGRGLTVLDGQWLEEFRDAPEVLFEQGLQWWCKQSGRRRVAAVTIPGPSGPTRAFLKAVENSGSGRWLDRMRSSTVRRAWNTGHAFLRRGIATPRPLFFVETRGPQSDCSYLLTEAVPHSVTLAEFCHTRWPQMSRTQQDRWVEAVCRTFAGQLQWMHACRFDHRDLKFENILVPEDCEHSATWLLDLDSVRRWLVLPSSRRVQNLARLNVSALHLPRLSLAQRLRFLRRYLRPDEWPRWKAWWRSIAQKSRRKVQQNRRRGRPLS